MYSCSSVTDDSRFRIQGCSDMEKKSQLIVVDAQILPDVFTKVLDVKIYNRDVLSCTASVTMFATSQEPRFEPVD